MTFVMPGPYHPLKPGERLEITFQDGIVLSGRVVNATPPSDDGSVTYTVVWDGGDGE
jgi:hypothetical protein